MHGLRACVIHAQYGGQEAATRAVVLGQRFSLRVLPAVVARSVQKAPSANGRAARSARLDERAENQRLPACSAGLKSAPSLFSLFGESAP